MSKGMVIVIPETVHLVAEVSHKFNHLSEHSGCGVYIVSELGSRRHYMGVQPYNFIYVYRSRIRHHKLRTRCLKR